MMLSESIKKDLIEERKRILSPYFEKNNNNFIMRYTTYCNEKNSSQIANIAKNILLLIQKYSFQNGQQLMNGILFCLKSLLILF
ncbi:MULTISPECIES: hypothetical protein [Proteus]|nr:MULTISPECIES: hypothetical protein [Proteus]